MNALSANKNSEQTDFFLRRHGWWLLILVALVMLLPGITAPLNDMDEARFSGATLEMIRRDEWVVPYFNGEYRFDKPPLIYWLQRLNFFIFGVNEFAARFHSPVATFGVALLISSFGRRLFSVQSGFIAAFAWLTCLQVQIHGRAAVADMPMIFCIVLAHRALFELILTSVTPRPYGRWFWAFYFSLALGFLAKGPVMFAVPFLTLVLYRFVFWRKPLPWKPLQIFPGLAISLGIVAIWGIPALLKTHGLFWKVGIGDHIIGRGGHSLWLKTTPFFYLMTAFLSLAPWTVCFWHGATALRQFWNRESAFLLSWLIGPYLLFSFYATQMPHYVMPAFPAFFLLLFQRSSPMIPPSHLEKIWFWSLLSVSTIALALIAWPLIRHPFSAEFDSMRTTALWFLAFVFGLFIIATGWRFNRLVALCPGVLVAAICMNFFMQGFSRIVPMIPLQTVFQQMPKNSEFLGFGYSEATLVYYSHHIWQFDSDLNQIDAALDKPGSHCVVCLRREFKFDEPFIRLLRNGSDSSQIPATIDNRAKLDSLHTAGYSQKLISGISFERASWVELEVFYRPN